MCVHPIILLLSVAPDNWDAETCSGVAHREEKRKRDSCAHPSLQTAECGNVGSGRRFKIMLLQAVQEREKKIVP